MTDSLHYIDSYFKGEFSADELKRFEQRIIEDPAFAEELAFYVSSVQVLRSQAAHEKKEQFRKIYEESKLQAPVRRIQPWYYAAAAVVVAIALSVFIFYPSDSPDALAGRYIKNHLSTLGVMMNSTQDNMQAAISLYNAGELNESLNRFEAILQAHPSESKAREYAGIVSLRLQQYDKALNYFNELAGDKRLYANPGKFYAALTLLKRNQPGDTNTAKTLLRQVVDEGLQNDQAAKELLDQL